LSVAALALVVLASLIHATWNLLTKRAAAAGAPFVLAGSAIGVVAYAPWVAYLLFRGGMAWSVPVFACIALSAIIHIGYSLSLQRGYQLADLSVVYPVARGTGPMLSTIGAILILGETPKVERLIGLAFVVAGIAMIATRGDLSTFRSSEAHRGVKWGAATGGFIASYTVTDAFAVKGLGVAPVVLDWCSLVLRCFVMAPILLRDPARAMTAMRGHWLTVIAVGVLSPLSYILVLTALSLGSPLSVVAPMREMSMMVGALMGMIVLKEDVGPWRLIGCAVLLAGVVFLAL